MDITSINERLALLAAEVQQIRIVVGQLADTIEDTTAGLVELDKNHAVADAKSDLRAERLVKLEAQIDRLAADLEGVAKPVREYFDAQNRTAANAVANRANLFAYLTPARLVSFFSTLAAAGAAFGWWHSTEDAKTVAPTVQESAPSGTVAE